MCAFSTKKTPNERAPRPEATNIPTFVFFADTAIEKFIPANHLLLACNLDTLPSLKRRGLERSSSVLLAMLLAHPVALLHNCRPRLSD
ncbi:hypothetical protein GUITHDRAFT_151889 [Guillardia theta CCMP2712]|uniref:Uncharacterized protein n=1 Tax=Guillardia theta (strain CCMP2712) TaxID=905079 RepID=L1JJD8_GUITC|nr:hypothetical protein GUITHDRAFT_151889 [Guillardia theta CCMP2712]EKX48422.1 hypothetical protein GUITHDRAFT_151889 [Guillardia theta CCMP2712]|eukprot:XP_005835402.1 hypothetical protein GUITHDRAFT_151889 [Guillardia theta CCMP2712]